MNVLSQGLLDKVSVDADAPNKIQSIGGEVCRIRVYSFLEGGIWSSTETFQSVRSRSASGELHQVVVGSLVSLAIGLVDGIHVARMLDLNRAISDTKTGFFIAKTYEDCSLERRVDGGRGEVGGNGESSCALAPAVSCVQCYE